MARPVFAPSRSGNGRRWIHRAEPAGCTGDASIRYGYGNSPGREMKKRERYIKFFKCEYCGQRTIGYARNQRFCKGTKCKQLYHARRKLRVRDMRYCKRCNREFVPHRDNQEFCCMECKRLYHAVQHMNDDDRVCEYCGRTFKPKRKAQRYCPGGKCRKLAYKQRSAQQCDTTK